MQKHPYPDGLKSGDFIQTVNHFGDIYFEVESCYCSGDYWNITYVTYDKYGSSPRTTWVNTATAIRNVIPAEMAVPVMMQKSIRFSAKIGQYDPIYGFAPAGKSLRVRSAA